MLETVAPLALIKKNTKKVRAALVPADLWTYAKNSPPEKVRIYRLKRK